MYTFGRTSFDPARKVAGLPNSGRRTAAPGEWTCFLKDRISAYITRERYEENRHRLSDNHLVGGVARTASGRAPTLLDGLMACGRCGRPMAARNSRPSIHRRYACDSAKQEFGGPFCQGVTASAIDRLIEALVLRAVEPAGLELSLGAA